jgi:hypothetical protein
MKIFTILTTLLVTTATSVADVGSRVSERDEKVVYLLTHMATVAILNQACPAWSIDHVALGFRMRDLQMKKEDFIPAVSQYRALVEKATTDAIIIVKVMTEREACEYAERMYGPEGRLLRGLMKR